MPLPEVTSKLTDTDWAIRHTVYATIRDTTTFPTALDVARDTGFSTAEVRESFRRLHEHHAFLLDPDDPGGTRIRIANPFSAVPTPFRVWANGRLYWANCAWDALGIPVALGSDGEVEARYTDDGTPATLSIRGGEIAGEGIVHFRIPVRHWYDNLIRT